MDQGGFDFAAEPVDPRSEPVPPSRGNTTRTKHCSEMGALDVQHRVGAQHETLLKAYRTHGDLTDAEMEEWAGIDRSTVIPRRHELMKRGLVVEVGTRKNVRTGVSNTTFGLKGL